MCQCVNASRYCEFFKKLSNMGAACSVVSKESRHTTISPIVLDADCELFLRDAGVGRRGRLLGGREPTIQGRSKERLGTIGDFRLNSRPPRPQQGMPNERLSQQLCESRQQFLPFPSSCLTMALLDPWDNSPFVLDIHRMHLSCPVSLPSHLSFIAIHPALTRFEQSLTKSHDRSDCSPDWLSVTPGTTAWNCHTAMPLLEYS